LGYSKVDVASSQEAIGDIKKFFSKKEYVKRFAKMPLKFGKELFSKVGLAAGVIFGALEYSHKVERGEKRWKAGMAAGGGIIGDVIGGAAGAALGFAVLGPPGSIIGGIAGALIGHGVGSFMGQAGAEGLDYLRRLGRRASRVELGGRQSAAMLTKAAYTMRSRALGQMQRSGINARSYLGREAALFHMR
jgi:hypothetical protein